MKIEEQVEIMKNYTTKILGLNLSEENILKQIKYSIKEDEKQHLIMLDYYKFLLEDTL